MIVIDIGNTNAVFGIYSNKKLNKIFRIKKDKEISKRKLMLINFLKKRKIFFDKSDNKICILSSVVPSLNSIIKNYFDKNKFKFHIITAKN